MMTRVDHRDERELERLGRVAARLFFENCQHVAHRKFLCSPVDDNLVERLTRLQEQIWFQFQTNCGFKT